MTSERTPLQPGQSHRSSRRSLAPALYGEASDADESQLHTPEQESRSVRLPRSLVYGVVLYSGLVTLALLILTLILLIPPSTPPAAAGDAASPPSITDPHSSTSNHLPYSSHSSAPPLPSSTGSFLVLSDIHLEPHYSATSPQARTAVCRDDAHTASCQPTDWEQPSQSSSSQSRPPPSPFPLGRYLCDPPDAFVSSAFSSLASRLSSTPLDFLLLAGDLAAHFVPCPLTLYHTLDRVFALLTAAFPTTPIVYSVGNTDVFPSYHLPSPSLTPPLSSITLTTCQPPFTSLLSILLRHRIFQPNDTDAIHTFCHGGYHTRTLAHRRLRIISLNTLVWATDYSDTAPADVAASASAKQAFACRSPWRGNSSAQPIELSPSTLSFSFPTCYPSNLQSTPALPCSSPARVDDPYDQFRYLEAQLSLAAQADPSLHVHIVGHVPPGVKPSASPSASWCPQYRRRFEEVVDRWASVVQGLMFGDYSQDLVRVMGEGERAKVVHINPGLSMRKNVNPAARVYVYDRSTGRILNYQQHYVDVTDLQMRSQQRMEGDSKRGWKEEGEGGVVWSWQYSAREHYGMSEYGADAWLSVAARMMTERDSLLRYVTAVDVWKAGQGDGVLYVCDMLLMDEQANAECRRTGRIPLRDGRVG